ncbi:MAG TPA: serpin family protein, partial [Bacteroidales bacterium]|nr:serpin family protein [Bacteroidales bacterium]
MKTRLIISVVIISLATMWSCKKDAPEMRDIPLSVQQKNMVVSGNAFAFNLLQRTVAFEETPKNIMISPLSVHYALAMTANGARNNTLAQMLEAMDFAQYDIDAFNQYFKFLMGVLTSLDDKVDLSIANSIWYRNTFSVLPAFLEVNQQYYNAEVSALDFDSPQAVNTINDWVDNATRGKIDEIVEDIGPDMVMFLINAI